MASGVVEVGDSDVVGAGAGADGKLAHEGDGPGLLAVGVLDVGAEDGLAGGWGGALARREGGTSQLGAGLGLGEHGLRKGLRAEPVGHLLPHLRDGEAGRQAQQERGGEQSGNFSHNCGNVSGKSYW